MWCHSAAIEITMHRNPTAKWKGHQFLLQLSPIRLPRVHQSAPDMDELASHEAIIIQQMTSDIYYKSSPFQEANHALFQAFSHRG